MQKLFLLIFFVALGSPVWAGEVERSPLSIGEALRFPSKILGEERTLNIYLPPGYHKDQSKRYPVIYLLDGSMEEGFLHIAGLVQFGSFSWIHMLPESILVGVGNVDRKRDFTYASNALKDQKEFPSSGGSSKFIASLMKEMQPLIQRNYRVSGETTLIGQSLGGLLATEILVKHTNLFDHYIIVSPSLWWDGESLLKRIPANCCAAKAIYVGVGKEGAVMERLARELHDKIDPNGQRETVHFGYFKQLDHGDTLHLAVYDAFGKLFSNKPPQE
ncbi:alpha/beta hydrolase [Microbulbifer spongiae]|uniref:Alpha/beta hydrolase-fold protein n=1 Tax=Microbulbifer spongiae TaxID=2944933 RepID=A0ABY9EBF6_9GAMM|nr:alpha/beta hydrolase-fold protein [Microbulbifer sp. MI-G]WKD50310.1 alpha/beta hydrolase-fold protein [Microbulbifer sp. MI-G]